MLTYLLSCCFRWRSWMWTLLVRAVLPGSWTPKTPNAPSAPSTRPPYSDWILCPPRPAPTPVPSALCLHFLDRHDRTPLFLLHTDTSCPFTYTFSSSCPVTPTNIHSPVRCTLSLKYWSKMFAKNTNDLTLCIHCL